ncbi:9782_t:CDS:2 [Funneliformis geosporum]|nr:9782_t:CDS:2 [Funneliformis geosporum]
MNQILKKLKEKFLPEAEIEDEICQEAFKNIQNLEKKLTNLERELELVADEAKPKTHEEIKKVQEKLVEEQKKIAHSRPKAITIRLRKNPDNKTIAHEFAHAFLV